MLNYILMKKAFIVFVVSFFLFFIYNIQEVSAANATMVFSPGTGSFGKEFTVNLVVDGHGDKFNAAQATVTLSSNLKIQNLVLGDCNFSYLKTPSIQNPSFSGVILSAGSTNCTVYTLTLTPVAKGKASILLSKASVKRYGDAAEILSLTNNATYTLTGIPKRKSDLQPNTSQKGLYTLYFKVLSPNGKVSNDSVILSSISKKNKQQTITDNNGIAHFSNLQAGVYDATVKESNNKVGDTIINVSGSNHVLTFGINLSDQKNNPLLKNSGFVLGSSTFSPIIIVILLVAIFIIGVTIMLIALRRRK
jgi:hypothetical protein